MPRFYNCTLVQENHFTSHFWFTHFS